MKKEIYIDDEVDRRLHRELAVEATVNLTCDPISELTYDMDVRDTINSLPALEKKICAMLLEGYSQSSICSALMISLRALQTKHLPFIRKRFLDYGFDKNELTF